MTRRDEHRRTSEAGIALPMALALSLVAAVIILTLMMSAMSASDRSRSSVNDALGRTPADQGAASYMRALNARAIGEHNDFRFNPNYPTPATSPIRELLPDDTEVLANSQLTAMGAGDLAKVDTSTLTGIPADSRFTYRRKTSDGVYTYWQLFSLVRPDWRSPGASPTSGSKVIAYFRGWVGNATSEGRPETVITRVEFRPQRFGDYQMIVDGQIRFEAGAQIRGPVHSNGFPDKMFGSIAPSDPRIMGAISCSGDARFSTSSGPIAITGGGCAADMLRPDVEETINVRALEAEANFHWKLCGGGSSYTSIDNKFRVQCRTAPTNGSEFVDVGNVGSIPSTIIVVNGSARVTGTVDPGQRVTVLAYDVANSTTGANIHVMSNVSHASNGMLGLFAGDDVFVETTVGSPCSVTRIDGAVIATTGTLSMPATWRVPLAPSGAVPLCGGSFTSYGSIASHYTPFLAMTATSGNVLLGFRSRVYSYDPAIRYTPPPGMPLAQQWQKYGYDEANKACFNPVTYQLQNMECA